MYVLGPAHPRGHTFVSTTMGLLGQRARMLAKCWNSLCLPLVESASLDFVWVVTICQGMKAHSEKFLGCRGYAHFAHQGVLVTKSI